MPLKVVYIDDEPGLCQILKESLESPSIHVDTFTNANEALKYIDQNPPHVVFIDYRLSDTTGDVVASRIDAKIPKCLLTGDIKGNDHPPFVRVFFKPLDFDAIEGYLAELKTDHDAA